MTAATSLADTAVVFARALAGKNARHLSDMSAQFVLPLYAGEINQVTDPEHVVDSIRRFHESILSDDLAVVEKTKKLNSISERLAFSYHLGSASVSRRLGALRTEVTKQAKNDYRDATTERLYNEAGHIFDRAAEKNIDFYPLSMRDNILQAATMLRDMDRYNNLVAGLTYENGTAWAANCGTYYGSLFRLASKVLIHD